LRLRSLGQDLRRETGAALRQGQLIVLGTAGVTGKRRAVSAAPEHALFVHGFMAHGAVFSPLREHVERHTGRSTSEVSYGPLERFERVAERVARAIQDAGPERPIAVVGHSLGGLLLRWAIQELDGAARVDRMVSLATPHFGTEAARIGVGPLVTALRPGSDVLLRLERTRNRAAHIRHVALVAARDRMIRPVASAALPGAEVHWLEGLGHNEMLFHPEVFSRVADVLTTEAPELERGEIA
jgi:pimeloyl-ACP methyl ester carboxylesterase